MKVYTTDKIRNVALLGHSGSGKTSLAESMAFLAGLTKRAGTVDAGNTISDYGKQEIKRKISIQTSVIPIPWEDSKINVIDTPGSLDFLGEVSEAMTAADSAIIVVSGKNGVESGTKRAWELCEKYNMPRMFFVTDMDIDDASYRQVVEDLRALYGKKIAPFHLPVRENGEFTGYVNVIQKIGKKWNKDGKVEHSDVPDYSKEYLDTYREDLMESVAETSEEFMDRYFNGEEFSEDEIRQALRKSVNTGDIVPVMMGSNILNRGQFTMMVDIVKYMPSPEHRECAGINADTNDVFNANYDFSLPKSAYVWKTMVDPFVGTYSFIKVNSGVLKTDDLMWNQKTESEEKIGKIYTLTGSKAEEVPELHAGDIGALSKLSKTKTTDTLSTKSKPVIFVKSGLPVPYTCMRYIVKKKGEEDKAAQALSKIGQENLTIKTEVDAANHQLLIYGLSEQQIDIVREILKEDYKVEIDLEKPLVAFKETIQGKADIDNKYKKQTGGHGQYGHVKMTFEPSGNLEEAYIFTESVVGGNVPKNYFPAVEKGLQEGVKAGPLAGYPVVGIKANLYDGSYHPVDSSEMAFKTASNVALKKGIMAAKPILLEPIESLSVVCPDEYTGDVMGDLNKRRARVLGMDAGEGGKTTVRAEIPSSELFGYGKDLRSITGGTGDFSYEFLRYQQAPSDVQQKEVEARAALLAENADQ
ncbi:MAG: elongation factor G [Lachnospiraceae bacterium]|nr:elongation factor G [Lachnospiraceae bacterium]